MCILRFAYARSFDEHLSEWDTSSVTRMVRTFEVAVNFNLDISPWDTSGVTDMHNMSGHCPLR